MPRKVYLVQGFYVFEHYYFIRCVCGAWIFICVYACVRVCNFSNLYVNTSQASIRSNVF